MPVRSLILRTSATFAAMSLAIVLLAPSGLRAGDKSEADGSLANGLHTVRIVDFLNFFSNVGALIYFVEPNDFGLPPGIITHCSGALIHERAFLVAGHCTAPAAVSCLS